MTLLRRRLDCGGEGACVRRYKPAAAIETVAQIAPLRFRRFSAAHQRWKGIKEGGDSAGRADVCRKEADGLRLADTSWTCICPRDLLFLQSGRARPSVRPQGRRWQTPRPRQSLWFTQRKPEWEKTQENTHLPDRMFSKSCPFNELCAPGFFFSLFFLF